MLISDGIENRYPFIDDVKPDLIEKGVTVHSILYSDDADPKMQGLSNDTGGSLFFDSGDGNSTDLLADLITISKTLTSSQMPGNVTAFSPKVQVGGCKFISICQHTSSQFLPAFM